MKSFVVVALVLFLACANAIFTEVHPANDPKCFMVREQSNRMVKNRKCGMYAPIPFTSFGPGIDPNVGFRIDDLGDGVKVLTEGSYFSIILETSLGEAVLVDPPEGNWGANSSFLISALQATTSQPIKTIVYSHYHLDHIGNAGNVASFFGATDIVCHAETQDLLAIHLADGDTRRPACTTTWSGIANHTLTVGNQTLELVYLGRGHKAGNIFIYHPFKKVLMLVDVIFPGWTPFRNLALGDDIPDFYENHDQALLFDFDFFVGGHLTFIGNRTDVITSKEHVKDIRDAALNALIGSDAPNFFALIAELGTFDPTSDNFLNQWLLFHTFFERAQDVCELQVLDKWLPVKNRRFGPTSSESSGPGSFQGQDRFILPIRLAAVDVFLREHCFTAIEAIRIEGGPLSSFPSHHLHARSINKKLAQFHQNQRDVQQRFSHETFNYWQNKKNNKRY